MASAFPKLDAIGLAPLGVAGLFWSLYGLSPRRAFWVAWAAGIVYFCLTFSWFGETAGAFIAPFGFLLTFGPALGDGFFSFALCGALFAYLAPRVDRTLLPLAGAAIFAALEWLRSEGLGPLSVPFAGLGYTEAAGPLAALAAFAGSYGITFALCVAGAYLAAVARANGERDRVLRAAAIAIGGVACAGALAWFAWPARNLAPANFRVAAVQGSIPQNVKATQAAFVLALQRYTQQTRLVAETHPQLVVWPETVMLVALNDDRQLSDRFGALAKSIHAELAVGTLEVMPDGTEYNVLYFYRNDGALDSIYRKRKLVPFAERVPARSLFAALPWIKFASNFGLGDRNGLVNVDGTVFAPIICWESGFGELATADVRDGANALIIATDDAWFGTTAGPYQHAQIAQMRAIETGRWIVRAASTGISGIVAPDGRYVAATKLNELTTVSGAIGPPVDTLYASIGEMPVVAVFVAIVLGVLALGRRGYRSLTR